MTYKQGLFLRIGDTFKHKTFTGIYTITDIKILPKTVKIKCDDGYEYTHKDVKELVR